LPQQANCKLQHSFHPEFSENLEVQAGTMEHIQQPVITFFMQTKPSDEAGYAQKITPDTETRHGGEKPEVCPLPREGTAQRCGNQVPSLP